MFPMLDGVWRVYRFSPGITEAETWQQDGEGWTCCYFNRVPDLALASRMAGGAETSRNGGGFVFNQAANAVKAAEALGQRIELPEKWLDSEVQLKKTKDGRLAAMVKQPEVAKGDNVENPGEGWVKHRGGWWEQFFNTRTEPKEEELGLGQHDDILRCLYTPAGRPCRLGGQDPGRPLDLAAQGRCEIDAAGAGARQGRSGDYRRRGHLEGLEVGKSPLPARISRQSLLELRGRQIPLPAGSNGRRSGSLSVRTGTRFCITSAKT